MGTRSLTIIKQAGLDSDDVAVMYRQFDGYPSGHGNDLVQRFGGHNIVNGYQFEQTIKTHANGMPCLAAQVVAAHKEEIGGIYLHPAGTRDCGEEYRYTLYISAEVRQPLGDEALQIKVESGYGSDWRTLYDGPIADADIEAMEKADQEEDAA